MNKEQQILEGTEQIKKGVTASVDDTLSDFSTMASFITKILDTIINFLKSFYNISKKYFLVNKNKGFAHLGIFTLLYIYFLWTLLGIFIYILTLGNGELTLSNIINFRINNTINEFIQRQITDNSIINKYKNSDDGIMKPDDLKQTSFYLLNDYHETINDLMSKYFIYTKEYTGYDGGLTLPTKEYIDFVNNINVNSILENNSNIKTNKINILSIVKDNDLDFSKVIVKGTALVNNDKIIYIGEINLKYIGIKEGYLISSYKFIQICGNKIQENIKNKCN